MSNNRWKEIDHNADTRLWEAPLPSGNGVVRVTGTLRPPDFMVDHHFARFGDNMPKCELGATGHRYLFPGETEWREYGFTPRKPA